MLTRFLLFWNVWCRVFSLATVVLLADSNCSIMQGLRVKYTTANTRINNPGGLNIHCGH